MKWRAAAHGGENIAFKLADLPQSRISKASFIENRALRDWGEMVDIVVQKMILFLPKSVAIANVNDKTSRS